MRARHAKRETGARAEAEECSTTPGRRTEAKVACRRGWVTREAKSSSASSPSTTGRGRGEEDMKTRTATEECAKLAIATSRQMGHSRRARFGSGAPETCTSIQGEEEEECPSLRSAPPPSASDSHASVQSHGQIRWCTRPLQGWAMRREPILSHPHATKRDATSSRRRRSASHCSSQSCLPSPPSARGLLRYGPPNGTDAATGGGTQARRHRTHSALSGTSMHASTAEARGGGWGGWGGWGGEEGEEGEEGMRAKPSPRRHSSRV